MDLRQFVRDVPDFPKPGIVFKDITPLLHSPEAFGRSLEALAEPFRGAGITNVVAIESRGFIFGSCLARSLECSLTLVRKPGKLPWSRIRNEYELEYGSDALEMHDDAIREGDRILIVDDVLATGGTASCAASLVQHFGATVASLAVLIELEFLSGRKRLGAIPVHSVIRY